MSYKLILLGIGESRESKMDYTNLKERVLNYLDGKRETITAISSKIHRNPELGFQEYLAMAALTEPLIQAGFSLHKGLAGMETAFRAEYPANNVSPDKHYGIGVPKIAFLAEYDALPGLGHGCGHNIIGAAAVGAALALREVLDELSGAVIVLGSPAEETGGGKVALLTHGVFTDVSAAMMIHPADRYMVNVSSLAMDALEFTYYGKSAHAGASPHEGRNALEGVIQMYNAVNSLRSSLRDGVRINGIITEGGQAANIIPAKATARYYVRAKNREALAKVVERMKACARGAAEATGTQVQWRNYEPSYDNMVTNQTLAGAFRRSLAALGISEVAEEKQGMGSLDMGNVSKVVPAIHPYIAIGPRGLTAHTFEFAQAADSPLGHEGLLIGAKALALTALEILTKPALLQEVQSEFGRTY